MNKLNLQAQAPPMKEPHPLSVSVEHGARLLGIGRTTMWACVSSGLVAVVRLSNRTLIPFAELELLMARPQEDIDAALKAFKESREARGER